MFYDDPAIVELRLTAKQIDNAKRYAERPFVDDEHSVDRPEHVRKAWRLNSLYAELAAQSYFMVAWNEGRRDAPDLADFIEVKDAPYPFPELPVQLHNCRDGHAYVLTSTLAFPLVKIYAFAWGASIKAKQHTENKGGAGGTVAHYVKLTDPIMREPWRLCTEIRERSIPIDMGYQWGAEHV